MKIKSTTNNSLLNLSRKTTFQIQTQGIKLPLTKIITTLYFSVTHFLRYFSAPHFLRLVWNGDTLSPAPLNLAEIPTDKIPTTDNIPTINRVYPSTANTTPSRSTAGTPNREELPVEEIRLSQTPLNPLKETISNTSQNPYVKGFFQHVYRIRNSELISPR